jgi:hypothetical protein
MNNSPIDAQALALGVAVEGLLAELYNDVVLPSDDFLRDLEAAEAFIQELPISPRVKSRILGSLGPMRKSRAKDRLRALVERNVITKAQYEAWEKLRNSTAHAVVHELSNKFIGLCNSVLVLAYCLMFNAISYVGPFTDYGTPGWPELWYPFGSLGTGDDNIGA